jgi:hypothetical protein
MAANNEPFYMRDINPDVAVFPDAVPPSYEGQGGGYSELNDADDRGRRPRNRRIGKLKWLFSLRPNAMELSDYSQYTLSGKGLASKAQVTKDGRINVSLNMKGKLPDLPKDWALAVEEFAVDETSFKDSPCLNIVIMIVVSRGDKH